MADDSPDGPRNSVSGRAWALSRWLAAGAVFLTAWTLVCAHAPSRIKLIGLFALAYGLLAGLVLKHLARLAGLRPSWQLPALTFVLVAAGQVGLALESHRLYAAEVQRNIESDKSRAALALMLQTSEPPADPESRALFDDMRQTLGAPSQTRFADYLQHRLSSLGNWPAPWPEVIWCLEIAASAAAAAWLASRPIKDEQTLGGGG